MARMRGSGPSIFHSLLEFRAGLEAVSLPASLPFLLRARRGEGQAVLVVPGFTASDQTTLFFRKYLARLGYDVFGWGQGLNDGLNGEMYGRLEQRLFDIHQRTGQAVSLVGWSLGGFYVRALANRHPEKVRCLITVATPFAMPTPKAINRVINHLYAYLNPDQQMDEFFTGSEMWEGAPVVPSTSIYSVGDGVNHWRCCLDSEGPQCENVRVFGSHCGLVVNPMVYRVIADRLAQDPRHWRHYQLPVISERLQQWFDGRPIGEKFLLR